jgi:hypothetical protein
MLFEVAALRGTGRGDASCWGADGGEGPNRTASLYSMGERAAAPLFVRLSWS